MRQPNPEDPTTYPQYDANVHDLPLKAKASAGATIQSNYVGSAVVVDVYPCTFYGAPPVYRGDPVSGRWDGLAYVVDSEWSGRTILDRSRLGRVTAAQPPAPSQPVTSSSLLSVEDDHEDEGSSEISLTAASQAEVASPFRHLSRCDSSPHGAPCVCLSGLDDVRDHRCPITAAQHVAALSMPFDPSAVSRSRCTFKVSNRPCDPTHPSKCSRASTHSLPEQGPTAPVTGAPMALLGVYAGCPDYFDDARDLYVRRVDAGDSDLLAMSYALHSATAPANYAPETWPDVSRGDRMVVRWLARNVAVI